MKKINVYLIFSLIIFCIGVKTPLAKTLTVQEVATEYKSTETAGLLGLTASVDETNKKIKTMAGDTPITEFNYTDDYIEYDNRTAEMNEENFEKNMYAALSLTGIMESIINLSGFEDQTLDMDEDFDENTLDYDSYGIKFETEKYSAESEGSSVSGDFVKYFKISLDTEKIAKLIEDYGKDVEKETYSVPKVQIKDIKTDSITIYGTVEGYDEDSLIKPNCAVYRSSTMDGEYTLLSETAIPCVGNVGYIDKELESGKTYYYTLRIENTDIYSEISMVTTLTKKDENKEKNPNTGSSLPLLTFLALTACSFGLIVVGNKKPFHKI